MLLTIIGAIVALSVLIVFHEFGHFLIAKWARIKVEEFSLGLGPKIIGIKKGETTYKLSWVPFGGYVKLAGMEPKEVKGESCEFVSKSARVKTSVVIAGPVFNFVLAIFLFILVAGIFGTPELPTRVVKSVGAIHELPLQIEVLPQDEIVAIDGNKVETWDDIIGRLYNRDSVNCLINRNGKQLEIKIYAGLELEPLILPIVGVVERGSPASKAGIREGDRIISVGAIHELPLQIQDWDALVAIIRKHPDKEISIGWQRDGDYMSANLIPKREQTMIRDSGSNNRIEDIGVIGVGIKLIRKPLGIKAFKEGFLRSTGTVVLTISFLKQLVTGKVSPRTLGGPVAIVKFAGKSARWGMEAFMSFVAFLSIQLFILNLIPFPPLDGGQILIVGIEKIRKKPISERGMNLVQNIGVILLIMLMLYVTLNDIGRLIK